MRKTKQFIIYAPRYNNASGGAIVLHKLCDTLNKQGLRSKLWPFGKPLPLSRLPLTSVPSAIAYLGSRIYRARYCTNEFYDTPIATASEIENSVIVYPEIINGNPLRAKRYVRWFLHKPGFHEGSFKYNKEDLCFSYQDAFNSIGDEIIYGGTLHVSEAFLDIYKLKNIEERTKICHMIRKGSTRSDLPDLRHEWVVDNRTHQELSAIFNECKICYFYDLYTAYATYAAVCGCIPVIVPVAGLTKEKWIPECNKRLGLAYGVEDIPHAIATRGLMLENLDVIAQKNNDSVERFVSVVDAYFNK
ncbi:MAG: hypothetical protein KGH90_01445 [Xanthomonadaceae bacterium]|nr:hypothetical protein [Xanthomonadaceae bacterium]